MLKSVALLIHINRYTKGLVFLLLLMFLVRVFLPYLLSKSLGFIPDFRTTAALIGNVFDSY